MHTFARWIAILATVMPLLGASADALAQQPAQTQSGERAAGPILFSLDFPGGSVAELARAIRQVNASANIVVADSAVQYRLPALQLRQVDMATVARIIEQLAVTETSDPPQQLMVFTTSIAGGRESAISIGVVTDSKTPQSHTRTWSVREHLEGGMAADDLLSAVQAMLETEPGATSVRFHEPTALLIIRGSGAQLGLVNDGLEQLRHEVRGDADRETNIRNELRALSDQMVHAEVDLRVANKSVEVARLQVDEIRKSVESGLANRVALAEAELLVVRTEGDLQIAGQRVQRLDAEVKRLRALLDE